MFILFFYYFILQESYKTKNSKSNIKVRFFEPSERALLAIQGPKAAECLQKLTSVDLSKLYFMNSVPGSVAGVHACRITRCGYTGEDGFEISVPAFKSLDLVNELIKDETVKLAGLGARDSLRWLQLFTFKTNYYWKSLEENRNSQKKNFQALLREFSSFFVVFFCGKLSSSNGRFWFLDLCYQRTCEKGNSSNGTRLLISWIVSGLSLFFLRYLASFLQDLTNANWSVPSYSLAAI